MDETCCIECRNQPKSSNISTGESRPEVTSGTECIGLHSVIWLLKLRQEQQLVPSNRLEQRSNSKVRRQTWPGHGLGPFSTDQLHLNIVWLSSASDVFQTGVPDFTRWKKKAEIAKYNFVAVRGTETKPCPGPLVLKLGANQTTLYFKPCHRNKRKLWANLEHD